MKVAIFSDFHMGIISDTELVLDIQNKVIDHLIKECNHREISTVFFLGDWFETRKAVNVKVLDESYKLLEKFRKNNIDLYMVVGNHDIYLKDDTSINSVNFYEEIENIHIVRCPLDLMLCNKKITLVPWGFPITDKSDVIMGHFSFKGALYSNDMVHENGTDPDDMVKFSPLVFSGHFHRHHEYGYKDGQIVVVGSPFQQKWDEAGEDKGFYILDLETMSREYVINPPGIPIRNKILLSTIINKTVDLTKIKNNFVKIIVDIDIDYDKVIKISDKLNKKSPLKSVALEFFNKVNKFTLPEVDDMPNKSFNKLDIINTYIEHLGEDSSVKFDKVKLGGMLHQLYRQTEIEGYDINE